MRAFLARLCLGNVVLILSGSLSPSANAQTVASDSVLIAIMRTEDLRPMDVAGLEAILAALNSNDSTLHRFAVRALGRLERPELVPHIQPALQSRWISVRIEAANALAQAVFNSTPKSAYDRLTERLATESDSVVLGALAHALGRLPYESTATMREVERVLLNAARHPNASDVTMLGVARGLEAFARRNRTKHEPGDETLMLLGELARFDGSARVRRLAVSALTMSGHAASDSLLFPEPDRDPEVRRLAVAALRVAEDSSTQARRFEYALLDGVARVRYEGWRTSDARERCGRLPVGLHDEYPHIALLALDLYGECRSVADAIDVLVSVVDGSRELHVTSWHARANALVALSKAAPSQAASHVVAFASDSVWQVRMYAARAAAQLRSRDVLEQLARDEHHNVSEAALRGLVEIGGQRFDSVYVAALETDDYQVLLTAAGALKGSPAGAEFVPALFIALRRVTADQRETSRDARVALLDRIGEFGNKAYAPDLEPFIRDFDPVLAAQSAAILTTWTDTVHAADPQPLSRVPFPSLGELRELDSTTVIVEMEGGGIVELRLFPFDAPTNSSRFARLARAGYFDGLTFHRVVPNFVIQGGSPGANEYVGDGPYTRDELTARSHLRGTVGLSTRGRDTGDAQIFINLVDNVRLDHNYTIFAEVVSGMDVVDRVLEGAVIERIRIRR